MSEGRSDTGAVLSLRSLHPVLRVRLGIAFVERALNTMVIPVMAIYLSAKLGAGTAGVLIAVSVGVAIVAGLASGHFADVLGRRRALLLGATTMTVAFVGMAAAAGPWTAPLGVFAFYLLQVGAASFIQPVHDAMIIDVTEPAERRVVYTINYWSFNIAMAIGALLGGFLYNRHLVGLLGGAAVCALGATLVTRRFLTETAPPAARAGAAAGAQAARGSAWLRNVAGGYAETFRDRRFLMLLAAMTLMLGLELQRTSGYVAVHIAHDVPTQNPLPLLSWLPDMTGVQILGLVLAANTIFVALLALVSGRLVRKFDDRTSVLLGVAVFTAATAVLAMSTTAWVLLLAVLVLTIGELLHIPVMESVLAGVVPAHARARYMAVFNLNVRGGMLIAALSLTVGGVLSGVGMSVLFAAIAVCAALLYRSLLAGPRPSPAPPSTARVAGAAQPPPTTRPERALP